MASLMKLLCFAPVVTYDGSSEVRCVLLTGSILCSLQGDSGFSGHDEAEKTCAADTTCVTLHNPLQRSIFNTKGPLHHIYSSRICYGQ